MKVFSLKGLVVILIGGILVYILGFIANNAGYPVPPWYVSVVVTEEVIFSAINIFDGSVVSFTNTVEDVPFVVTVDGVPTTYANDAQGLIVTANSEIKLYRWVFDSDSRRTPIVVAFGKRGYNDGEIFTHTRWQAHQVPLD